MQPESTEHAVSDPAPPSPAPSKRLVSRLSARLLALTVGFVMLAEIAVFVPSMAHVRLDYLTMKLATAHLVMTALEASPGQVDPVLRDRLLNRGDMLGVTVLRPDMPPRTLGPRMPSKIPRVFDLRKDNSWDSIRDAFAVMVRGDMSVMAVTGVSPSDPTAIVEVVLEEAPLRAAMYDYAKNLLLVSVFISVVTAMLVFASLQWLAVRPLRLLTESMIGFREAPEDPHRIIKPSDRHDEVGVAERALASMQQELREALLQKERLAGVGTAVTKISHDLKNILASAMLESDRLESVSDPEVRRITSGILRAVDRAVALSASTLRFAKEGLPEVKTKLLTTRAFLDEIQPQLQHAFAAVTMTRGDVADLAFEGDPELLQRAFENLIRNAAEAGARTIVLSAKQYNDYATIHIGDDGPGLPPKALANLFVPFSGSARPGGSGLGLPIARELLRVQGGDLVLESTSDEGTCFAVRLPQGPHAL